MTLAVVFVVGFGLVALALAGPVPVVLAAARWPREHPAAALVVWQLVGLGGGLALLGAELALAGFCRVAGLVAFVVTALWLVAVLLRSTARVLSARRRHRDLLDLLAERAQADLPVDVVVLAHQATAAYSVPGRPGRIVVSAGACAELDRAQLAAVIEHERAHLRQHHDVVVQPFVAWQRSFPFLRPAVRAVGAVELLTEYLADDAARDRTGGDPLVQALTVMELHGYDVGDRRSRLTSR